MDVIPVSSSNVAAIGYQDHVIEVHFHNGYVYQYTGTTETLFHEFLTASSKGKFVHQRLKNQYPAHRIR